jgi:hypothetical protein
VSTDAPNFRLITEDLTPPAGDRASEPAASSPARAPKRNRAVRPLPSKRLRFESQLRVLKGWTVAGKRSASPTNGDVEDICGIAATTISTNNAFFVDANLLLKDGGGYRPSPVALEFGRADEFHAPDAIRKLAPALAGTWFFETLSGRLEFGPLAVDDAILRLAEQSGADTEHRPQLEVILEWLKATGLIAVQGDQISAVAFERSASASSDVDPERDSASPPTSSSTPPPPLPEMGNPTAGAISFAVSINVDMAELMSWDAPRIQAFFQGLALVIGAQQNAGVEQHP